MIDTLVVVACLLAADAKKAPPVQVSNGGVKETGLATVTLTPQAEQRLGIETATVSEKPAPRMRAFAGEVVLPPGRSVTISAPVSGTLAASPSPPSPGVAVRKGQPLFVILPYVSVERDLRVRIEAEKTSAQSRFDTAKAKAARAEQLLKDGAGSQRALEDANYELSLSTAALEAAKARLDQINRAPLEADVTIPVPAPRDGILRQILAVPGQAVSGGAPLAEIADLDRLWVRVPVYTGDLDAIVRSAPASIRGFAAQPVQAPPTADPLAASVDLYYELPTGRFSPGQRVQVTLPFQGQQRAVHVPAAAILYDIHGSAWLYEASAPHTFIRRRVDLDHISGSTAILTRGPKAGAKVVTAGAAELFGTEFGAGK